MELFENSRENLNIFNELKNSKIIKKNTKRKSIKNIFTRRKNSKLKKNNTKTKSKNNSSKKKSYSLFSRTKKNKSQQKTQTQQRRIYKQPGNTRSKAVMEGVRNVGRIDFMGWASLF